MGISALGRVRSVGLLAGSTSPVAIDFGVGSLKVLQVQMGDTPSLIAAAEVQTPDDLMLDHQKRFDFQADALAKVIRTGFRGRRVVCGIPSAQIFCRHMQLPKADNVDSQVQSSVSEHLGCHPDALVYRHILVDEAHGTVGGGKSEVICLATPRDLINRIMGVLDKAKLDPVGIHPACLATTLALEPWSGQAESASDTTLCLDLGTGATTCLIRHGSQLVFVKPIVIGGRQFDEAISRQMKCKIDWARQQRRQTEQLVWKAPTDGAVAAPSEGGAATAVAEPPKPAAFCFDLGPTLECITDEVATCLRYHELMFSGRRVSRIIFVGGEARHKGLCRHIAGRLNLPGAVADPMSRLGRQGDEPSKGVDFKAAQPGWATTLGLAVSPADL